MTATIILSIILAIVVIATIANSILVAWLARDVDFQAGVTLDLADIVTQLDEDAEAVIGELTETTDDLTTRVAELEETVANGSEQLAELEGAAEFVNECLEADGEDIAYLQGAVERVAEADGAKHRAVCERLRKLEQDAIYHRAPCPTAVVGGVKRIVAHVSAGRKPAGLGWDVA